MALTRDFRETVQARVRRDAAFRKGLLRDAVESLLAGEVALGKELLRDYINATVGFPKLGEVTGLHVKTLHQMFGPREIRRPATCLKSLRISRSRKVSACKSALPRRWRDRFRETVLPLVSLNARENDAAPAIAPSGSCSQPSPKAGERLGHPAGLFGCGDAANYA